MLPGANRNWPWDSPPETMDEPLRILLGHLWHRIRQARDRPDAVSLERCLEDIGDPWPDSLLYHLCHLSLREVWRWARWAAEGRSGPPPSEARTLRQLGSAFPNPGAWVGDPGWALEIFGSVVEGLLDLAMADHGEHGDVERGWLGLALQPVAIPEALQTTVTQSQGLMVMAASKDGPAARAGVLPLHSPPDRAFPA